MRFSDAGNVGLGRPKATASACEWVEIEKRGRPTGASFGVIDPKSDSVPLPFEVFPILLFISVG